LIKDFPPTLKLIYRLLGYSLVNLWSATEILPSVETFYTSPSWRCLCFVWHSIKIGATSST